MSAPDPHPLPFSLVGSYVYSYDVAAAHRQPTTVTSRPIPGMRPSYDAEHPHSTTPIYDELYSEYRRLFRALPGDRSGEEDLRFAGFAVREPYPSRSEARSYPPQQQAFLTYAGQALGAPQFMPGQQNGQQGQEGGTAGGPAGGQPEERTDGQSGQPAGLRAGSQAGSHGGQLGNGQGWVAAGYLGPVQAAGAGVGGRHRNRLSLPPGRSSGES
ncbi:hypothetical protein GCM10010495_63070 [Kitasatospora herbaricolor]|uniref:hypothetical protein n=1 Tax=Kitasatospora herbaricolor TaxID=68217 RepID=UPI00174AD186|nr:hypothetical protein [Kitasatospora herbaricolor]MDQ0311303.1 hypothetical protein [Kitasatospora herbaricolor]GGV37232.1 hypothetical protein GCM10010495_63070 [Kitasatospora herbaricolor]